MKNMLKEIFDLPQIFIVNPKYYSKWLPYGAEDWPKEILEAYQEIK